MPAPSLTLVESSAAPSSSATAAPQEEWINPDFIDIAEIELTERERRAWWLTSYEQLTGQQVAERMGCSLRTVRYDLAHARAKMESALSVKSAGPVRLRIAVREGHSCFDLPNTTLIDVLNQLRRKQVLQAA